jgi:integrase
MATIQKRGESYRIIFSYQRQQHSVTIGKVSKNEAVQWQGKVDHILMRLKQNLLELPGGVPITSFVLNDGKKPANPISQATFGQLRDQYLSVRSNGSLESGTIKTLKLQLAHVEATLGKNFLLCSLSHQKLQEHIDRRSTMFRPQPKRNKKNEKKPRPKKRPISPVTIRKEINAFRAAWNYGVRAGLTHGAFPNAGLSYGKTVEQLPFMSWKEIERRVAAGASKELWSTLYLQPDEITELLGFVKKRNCQPWVYPMFTMAAHTGMRRSELLRCRVEDVDLAGKTITVHEKKKSRGTLTTRRVPITPLLAAAIAPMMEGRIYLFGNGIEPLSIDHAKQTFRRVLAKSKWENVRGFHCLRHSWCSIMASKGVDQRVIDDCIGHSTDQQRRRYRHLFPHVAQDAVQMAFA